MIKYRANSRFRKQTVLGLACVVSTAVAVALLGGANAADSSATTDDPQSSFSGLLIHLQTTQYINYEARGKQALPPATLSRQTFTQSEKWIRLNESGEATAFRTITKLKDGAVVQDQAFADGREVVNFYGWNDTSLNCSETLAMGRIGAGFSVMTAGRALGAGYVSESSATTGEANAAYSKLLVVTRDGFAQERKTLVLDTSTGLVLSDAVIGIDAHGSETVIEQRTTSKMTSAPLDFALFEGFEALLPCSHLPAGVAAK